jgi:fluoride exporter
MLQTALVFLGGGVGAASRHSVNVAAARLLGLGFPWAGSLAMGLIAGWFAFKAGHGLSQHARLFLTTGVLGGFTTFSAFSLDAVLLWERNEVGLALGYVAASLILSILGLFAGLWLVRTFT